MAYIKFELNTSASPLGFLSPLDLELASAVIDTFYLTCLRRELASRFSGGSIQSPISRSTYPRRNVIMSNYEIKIEVISFSNPLGIGAFLQNVTVGTAQRILERTLFYSQERDRREINNNIARQTLIDLKLRNVQKAAAVRKKLISQGLSEDDATKAIGSLLNDEGASLRITDRD
jgi:hypothetical protein